MRVVCALALFLLFSRDLVTSLRILELRAPAYVAEGSSMTLECQFDMGHERLYAVKWYKDSKEFYRKVATNENPLLFSTPGVIVDTKRSTMNIISLKHVTRSSAGLYACEVSGEAPEFKTVTKGQYIEVYLIPKEPPVLTGLKDQYKVGDQLAVNCTSRMSRPEAELTWYINDQKAPNQYLVGPWLMASNDNSSSQKILQLKFTVNHNHFKFGQMKLKCSARVVPLYEKETSHHLHWLQSTSPEFAEKNNPEPPVTYLYDTSPPLTSPHTTEAPITVSTTFQTPMLILIIVGAIAMLLMTIGIIFMCFKRSITIKEEKNIEDGGSQQVS